ncbi:MAG: hypothetical protein CMC84_07895 [Flavobacteriaceae bacterium]|nr:hypothetical protein [Flavobacteriaceae bacterium]|tara:strand:- start:4748 stop:6208 length:1461 start_codon:yes stop_codon:yes gene_type:complete
MNILFISGYSSWGVKFTKVAEKLIKKNEISNYHLLTQGIDSYEDVNKLDSQGVHIVFESLYKNFISSFQEIDLNELELRYGSLYKVAASDRTLIQFTHPLNYGAQHSKEFILQYAGFWLNYFENYIENNNIDVIVTSVIASCMPLAASMVAEHKNLPLLNLGETRYPDRTCFFSDIKRTRKVKFQEINSHHLDKADSLITKLREKEDLKPSWADWKEDIANPFKPSNYLKFFRNNNLYKKYQEYFDLSNFDDPILFLPTRTLRIRKYFLKVYRKLYFRTIKKLLNFSNKEYYLYTLHVDPEMATSVLALDWIDQLDLIKRIKINMKYDRLLLVKEHPTMIGMRDSRFYKELRKIPGVEICSDILDTGDLIRDSKMVISITGTASLEAALAGKPSFLFAKTDFSKLTSISVFDGNLGSLDEQLRKAELSSLQDNELRTFFANNFANSIEIVGSDIWNPTKKGEDYIEKISDLLSNCLASISSKVRKI